MSLPMQEQWRPVPGWEDRYEVSDQGNVRTVARICHDAIGRHRRLRAQLLRPYRLNGGRRAIKLAAPDRTRNTPVSALVLEAFVGPRPSDMYVCHNDGDEMNDRLDNLRWDTPSANNFDTVKHGTHRWASRDKCMRGHLLQEPNLSSCYPKGRGCLACQRGRAFTKERQRKGQPSPDLQTASDAHYARITTGADIRWLYRTA